MTMVPNHHNDNHEHLSSWPLVNDQGIQVFTKIITVFIPTTTTWIHCLFQSAHQFQWRWRWLLWCKTILSHTTLQLYCADTHSFHQKIMFVAAKLYELNICLWIHPKTLHHHLFPIIPQCHHLSYQYEVDSGEENIWYPHNIVTRRWYLQQQSFFNSVSGFTLKTSPSLLDNFPMSCYRKSSHVKHGFAWRKHFMFPRTPEDNICLWIRTKTLNHQSPPLPDNS